MLRVIAILPLLMLPACATVIKGTSQDIAVSSTPDGAACQVVKGAAQVATIPNTPAIVKLNRGSEDTVITCTKPGYDKTAVTMSPSFNGATFGNILIGGIVGIVVDASTGANYTYNDRVNIVLPPAGPVASAIPTEPVPYVPGQAIRLAPQQPGV